MRGKNSTTEPISKPPDYLCRSCPPPLSSTADKLASFLREVEVEPDFDSRFPAKAIAAVAITTRDGKRYDSGAVEAHWQAPDTLPSDSELKEKFIWRGCGAG
ncbi:MAG: hypothetical protein HY895_16725 [Deltaproteobacteria bacterium]|nr:hypothetical protein [Deltaproteobacteria bacterium]